MKRGMRLLFSSDFFGSSLVQWVLIASLILNVASWITIAFFIRPVDFLIILHYNVYFGVDLIGSWWQAYFLPLVGTVVLLINTIIGYLFYNQKDRLVAHLLMLATCIAQVGVAISVICISIINY